MIIITILEKHICFCPETKKIFLLSVVLPQTTIYISELANLKLALDISKIWCLHCHDCDVDSVTSYVSTRNILAVEFC